MAIRDDYTIKALRKVLCIIFGEGASLLDEEYIDKLANMLIGEHLLLDVILGMWMVKISNSEVWGLAWKDIRPEPIKPVCTYSNIYAACHKLLLNNPEIWAIEISGTIDGQDRVFELRRSEVLQMQETFNVAQALSLCNISM